MTKISAVAPKSYTREVIEELHDLGLMDIEAPKEDIETAEPLDEAEELSKTLVDVRSVLSKLPETEKESGRSYRLSDVQKNVERVKTRLEEFKSEKNRLEKELGDLKDQEEFFQRLRGSGLTVSDLEGARNLDVFIGRLESDIAGEVEDDRFEVYRGESAEVVFYHGESEELSDFFSGNTEERYTLPDVDYSGAPEEVLEQIEEEKARLKQRIEGKRQDIAEVSREWRKPLKEAEEFLAEKVEKAEAPLKFGSTSQAFVVRGWIPQKSYTEVEERLAEVAEGRIHLEREETDEEPPVKHDNPSPVQPFESLSDLVGTPRYNEVDPSIVIFLTFPLFFGFMIGDMGYGLTTLAVFYAGYRMIPGAKDIFKSLMYASVATFIFGALFGDVFGYVAFGHHSEIAAATGLHFLKQIPIIFHRAEHLGTVFTMSAAIGVFHINAGYLIGFYNEHVRHGFREAFLEKGSWLLLEAGAALAYFYGFAVGGPVMLISALLLYLGEGMEGIVEIPSLLSNILSYTRIFGVAVAAVSLAKVVNGLANPFFQSGSLIGVMLGIFVLAFGHGFNTFIKIMEGFLQGIRLHYVEMFQKFYEGGGRKYSPFGAS
ncbi:MAG: V-type ATP synthase subunit I [Candidatus Nanohaloarchaea archaeon]